MLPCGGIDIVEGRGCIISFLFFTLSSLLFALFVLVGGIGKGAASPTLTVAVQDERQLKAIFGGGTVCL